MDDSLQISLDEDDGEEKASEEENEDIEEQQKSSSEESDYEFKIDKSSENKINTTRKVIQ